MSDTVMKGVAMIDHPEFAAGWEGPSTALNPAPHGGETIPREALIQALRALGLDPWTTGEVHIFRDRIEVLCLPRGYAEVQNRTIGIEDAR